MRRMRAISIRQPWAEEILKGDKKDETSPWLRATGRKIICADDTFKLREALTPYGKAINSNLGNTFFWD